MFLLNIAFRHGERRDAGMGGQPSSTVQKAVTKVITCQRLLRNNRLSDSLRGLSGYTLPFIRGTLNVQMNQWRLVIMTR
jgi:hypothetical protein